MKHTVNQTLVRTINKKVILEEIAAHDSISKAELSRRLHISKAALKEIVDELILTGIVAEAGEGCSRPAKGGRKPTLLRFNGNFKYIIVIDLNRVDSVFSLLDLAGQIIQQFTAPISQEAAQPISFALMKNAIDRLLSALPAARDALACIAVSTPGIFDTAKNEHTANPQFKHWQLDRVIPEIKRHYNKPIHVRNDLNCAAIGEFHFGEGKAFGNLVYISCGLGLGAGIILDNKIYEGKSSGAGEIASFTTPELYLGRLGTGEKNSIEKGLILSDLIHHVKTASPDRTRRYFIEKGIDINRLKLADIVACWRSGDAFIQNAVEMIGISLGCIISNMISLLNCEIVILGGEYLVFEEQLLPAINTVVQHCAFMPVTVTASSLGMQAGTYGLFITAQSEILNDICNRSDMPNTRKA